MTAEICKFPVPESEDDEIKRLRASMRAWHTEARGGTTPLEVLVWREVELAMGTNNLHLVRNAAAALREFGELKLSDIPF